MKNERIQATLRTVQRSLTGRSRQLINDPFCTGVSMQNRGRRIGYIRVSRNNQNTDRQLLGLHKCCDEVHVECLSAVANQRPVFEDVISGLQPGDTFTVWDLDRAFRSTVDAILTAERLRASSVHFRIVTMHVDTSTEEGELFYTIVAGFAQYERRMIARRTREGMEAARKRGAQIGRPRSLNKHTVFEAHAWLAETGYPPAYVAALLGVSRITLQRAFHRYGMPVHQVAKIVTQKERKTLNVESDNYRFG